MEEGFDAVGGAVEESFEAVGESVFALDDRVGRARASVETALNELVSGVGDKIQAGVLRGGQVCFLPRVVSFEAKHAGEGSGVEGGKIHNTREGQATDRPGRQADRQIDRQ